MRNKRQVFLSLNHRGALTLGDSGQQLGFAAFHWGIHIVPKKQNRASFSSFDVSNGALLDPDNRIDLNPDGNWLFRAKANANSEETSNLILRVMIGKVPSEITNAKIEDLLRAIHVPQYGAIPEQNCVSWTRAAILKLRDNGLVEKFDIDQFMIEQLERAFHRLGDFDNTSDIINYTVRPM